MNFWLLFRGFNFFIIDLDYGICISIVYMEDVLGSIRGVAWLPFTFMDFNRVQPTSMLWLSVGWAVRMRKSVL